MKACILIGVLVMVVFVIGKVPDVRTCHFCLLEDTSLGCISGSEKCTISSSSPCMVITIYSERKARFNVRGCGQHNNYRCQEKRNTYLAEYWYKAECCRYDYCNSWSKARLRDPLRSPSRPLPPPDPQTHRFYRALNLSLPLPGFHAEKEPEGLDPLTLPLELGFSITDLRRIYLFLNSSGLLALPRADPDPPSSRTLLCSRASPEQPAPALPWDPQSSDPCDLSVLSCACRALGGILVLVLVFLPPRQESQVWIPPRLT